MTPKAKRLIRPPRKSRGPVRLSATEREQLAQTLHDTVCQSLTAAYFSAKFIEQRSRGGKPLSPEELGELCEMIHGVVSELQEFARKLRGEEKSAFSRSGETGC